MSARSPRRSQQRRQARSAREYLSAFALPPGARPVAVVYARGDCAGVRSPLPPSELAALFMRLATAKDDESDAAKAVKEAGRG